MSRPAISSSVVGRLAPSPTGGLHVGHARTFLLAWLAARRASGRVVLRIEDIDVSRVRPESISGAIADLRWLGLDWDEGPDIGGPHGPYLQSRRLGRYDESLERLRRMELVYPCTCTRADIARAASAPHAEDEGPTYPGTCAGRNAGDAAALGDRPFAWRFRVPARAVAWDDSVLGRVEIDPGRVGGDFVVGRSGSAPSYQLAVVVDDAAMGINEVIRGDDLVASTPRQLLLFEALGWVAPRYGHVPLVVGPDGRRLAKRDRSIKLEELRARGVDPRRLVQWIAASCGWDEAPALCRPADWLARGEMLRCPMGVAVFDVQESLEPERRGA
jgi:glutamyl-tRNA synthetase